MKPISLLRGEKLAIKHLSSGVHFMSGYISVCFKIFADYISLTLIYP
jgi:hypothetical protein